jgi:hypothetical protein
MMDRKAQGMSLKVVIVAVLALIILIVLVLVFTGKLKFFGSGASDTAGQFTQQCRVPGTGNECMDEYTCNERGGSWREAPYNVENYDCPEGCCTL